MTIAIFGSCVSRDLFEDSKLRPHLGHYAARSSVVSAVAPPMAIDEERVVLSSDWQRRCVLADFRKTFFASLEAAPPDWLIIDLVDERFDLLRGEGSFVTRSSAFQAAGLDQDPALELEVVKRMSPGGCALFDEAAEAFARRVTAIVPAERVVLHRALWCLRYRNEEGDVEAFPSPRQELSHLQNTMLNRGYDALEAAFGGRAVTVDVDPAGQLADANHRWELEPFHYEPAYNEATARRLEGLFGL